MADGAEDDEADETEDRRSAEGEDCVGGNAGAGDGGRSGPALRGPPEPDLRPRAASASHRPRRRNRTPSPRCSRSCFFQLLDRDHGKLSIRGQCTLLSVARSGVYRPPRPANDDDLSLMRRIDELFTAWPFLGSRRMTVMLRAESRPVNRKRV